MDNQFKFQGYLVNQDGSYGKPEMILSKQAFSGFLINHVETHYELRIVDMDDMCVFQVIDQTLIFPIPEGGSKNNKWNPLMKRFENIKE